MTNISVDENCNSGYRANDMIALLFVEGWYVSAIFMDQWSAIVLKNEDSSDTMKIECDIIEHGLAVALRIANTIADVATSN
ncbi:hypothetical protein [Photobacterium kishitanii]|uniref:Uncharacterized protein n=1 Tax=Photobacterium kishitanii TaxID=318456 RepID=A0A2T3KLC9_9GAMM|nr:hypothetical protein [Photobacterium kishitanii]PSV00463.1 hypothetical protein C9J27_04845 [Photobacterium kishitanii]